MTANDFLDLLRRSQLLDEDQLSKFLGGVAVERKHRFSEDAEPIAVAMIESGILTEWQSEKLLAGRHKGFLLGEYKLLSHLGKSQSYLAEYLPTHQHIKIAVSRDGTVSEL
jgi:serine/threonine-protein kinase